MSGRPIKRTLRRCEARGWRSAYFSQPILEGDRSLFSPAPSPLVPRQ